jgi:hypothetical protein
MRSSLTIAVVASLISAFAPACSHEIESPPIASDRVDPDLACNATPASRPFSTVTIHGSNMTPMPSKTLEDKRELILPKVNLTMVTAIPEGGTAAAPFDIVDDPAKPNESRVKWTSESQMAIEIHETDKLPTGVMTIKVTNPDGKASTTINGNLAIVPKPTINELKPPAICDDQSDQTVVVNGSNFLFFDSQAPTVKVGDKTYSATADGATCKAIPGTFREKDVKLCSTVTIKIPKGDFKVDKPTKVAVTLTNPAPADCQSSETIELTINPPPKVTSVVPATVCEGGSQLTINGENFITGAKVIIDCSGKRVESSSATVTPDGKQVSATFGPGATPGMKCDVIVVNPDGCEDRPLPHQQITVTTGPIIFYSDPPVVYNGVNTQITIFATTIAGDPEVTITPSGMATPVTTLMDTAVTGHPNRRQALVPSGQAAGEYDIKLKDSTACSATLPKGLKVVSELTVTMKNVVPPFGWTGEDTPVTVFRDTAAAAPANKEFQNGARLFMNPVMAAATDVAVPLVGIDFLDKDRLTGVVPKGTPVKKYDLIIVNPDGSVGLLKNAYDELTNAAPRIDTVTPSSIVAATGQQVTVVGANFDAAATVSLTCQDAAGMTLTPTATITTPTGGGTTKRTVTIDGSTLSAGTVCVLRITNPDKSYGDYSAIGVTTPSLNLSTPKAGTTMNTARRALTAASGHATAAQRFVYAIGGDAGTAAGALDTYEFAAVDLFGKMGAWVTSPVKLAAKRTLAGSVTIGRYIYNVGGDEGAGPSQTAERAMILSPLESPEITDLDLALEMVGLDPGMYQYRVSATFAATDTDNPNGESLASDPFTLRVPTYPDKKIPVTIVWKKPVDGLGATLPNISGYKIYRTPKDGMPGSEALIATVTGADTLTFKDDGTKMPGAEKPLPLGSTGAWLKLPNLGSKRSAPGVAWAWDPADATKFYVYAIMGNSAAATPTGSYEFLPVTVAANGRQSAAAAWTAGTTTNAAPRSEFGAFIVTSATTNLVTGADTWIYAGGGRGATALSGAVDAAKVQAGGALGAWDTSPKDFSADSAGYGICSANNSMFVFGGANGAPSAGAKAAKFQSPMPSLNVNAWNNEGLTMTQSRYLLGSSVESAFIFLLGGQTGTEAASKSTETVVW